MRLKTGILTGLAGAGIIAGLIPQAYAASGGVYIGDFAPGGIKYHLNYIIDQTNTAYSAHSGQALSVKGDWPNYTDSPGSTGSPARGDRAAQPPVDPDGLVDTIGSASWHDLTTLNDVNGEYGWGHSSRWAQIDLNPLYHQGYRDVKVTIKLEGYGDASDPAGDLIPGVTVWQGLQFRGKHNAVYPNGATSTNWDDWAVASESDELSREAQAGNVWWAADDIDSPTGQAEVTITSLALDPNGSSYLTVALGGNGSLDQTDKHAVNFMATVTVQAVPIPGAVYLLGSSLIGLFGLARRKVQQPNFAAGSDT